MDDINKQIEEMADKMEKSTQSPNEQLFAVIKSLGKEGLKAKMATLSDEEKVVLKAALEEMTLKKAVSFDDQYQAKFVQGNIMDTKIQEDKADDDQDEKLVKPAAAKMAHQGTPTDGWDGQVIKSMEDNIDQVIEKAMEKCKDDKMVMKKLKEKGMDEAKVQGALEKYKAKKDMKKSDEDLEKGKMKEAREEAKEKIMSMEEKEHGTKDPKKLVAAEKKEHMKKGELPEKANPEVDQVGDAPSMEGGKQMAKKTAAPEIEALGKDNKKNMTKSITWEDETRLLKANTQGRNFNFNVEQFINETLANEPKEEVKKSAEGKEDLNDLIQKGQDKSWTQVTGEAQATESKAKQNGSLTKSFSDEDLRTAMGLSQEDFDKMMNS